MGLDSIELIVEVEKYFSISIPDREAEKAYTVGKLVDCVANILGINRYDFSLREKTFALVKTELINLKKGINNFSINSKVIDSLDIHDQPLITELENKINLKLPCIDSKQENKSWLLEKIRKWFPGIDQVDSEEINWKKFIDIILATNLENIILPTPYNSKYEIYIAIMRITGDKIGVNYAEIGIEKSFTDDLGVD